MAEMQVIFQLVAVEIILTVEVQRCLLFGTENIVKICLAELVLDIALIRVVEQLAAVAEDNEIRRAYGSLGHVIDLQALALV